MYSYTPDAKIYYSDGSIEVIEIKSKLNPPDERDCAKIQYAEEHLKKDGIKFKVWVYPNKGPREILSVKQRCADKID